MFPTKRSPCYILSKFVYATYILPKCKSRWVYSSTFKIIILDMFSLKKERKIIYWKNWGKSRVSRYFGWNGTRRMGVGVGGGGPVLKYLWKAQGIVCFCFCKIAFKSLDKNTKKIRSLLVCSCNIVRLLYLFWRIIVSTYYALVL